MPGYKRAIDKEQLAKTGKCKWRLYVSNKFRADGKPNRTSKTVGPCSEAQADKLLQKMYLEFSNQAPQNANRIRFAEFADLWLEKHSKTKSPDYHRGNTIAIKTRLNPYFGNLRLNKITADIIIDYFDELRTNGERLDGQDGSIKPGTVYWLFRILRSMLNQAKEWNYLSYNPIDDIPKEKRPKAKYTVKKILEVDQLSIFLQKLFSLKESRRAIKHQLFFYIALITGCRTGEILSLTFNDIDFASKTITIAKDVYNKDGHTMTQNRTKNMETRIVYCDDFCLELLRKHEGYQAAWLEKLKMNNPNNYIFIKEPRKQEHPSDAELPSRGLFYEYLQSFLQEAELPSIDVHGLRRTTASYAENNHVPLTTIQSMLGHKNLSTTIIYLRTLNENRKKGTEILSNAYQQLMTKA